MTVVPGQPTSEVTLPTSIPNGVRTTKLTRAQTPGVERGSAARSRLLAPSSDRWPDPDPRTNRAATAIPAGRRQSGTRSCPVEPDSNGDGRGPASPTTGWFSLGGPLTQTRVGDRHVTDALSRRDAHGNTSVMARVAHALKRTYPSLCAGERPARTPLDPSKCPALVFLIRRASPPARWTRLARFIGDRRNPVPRSGCYPSPPRHRTPGPFDPNSGGSRLACCSRIVTARGAAACPGHSCTTP